MFQGSFRRASQRRGDGKLALTNGRISTGISGVGGRSKTVFQVEIKATAMAQKWERADETGD